MIQQLSKMFLDSYDRNARLAPALLALMPVPVLIVCLAEPTRKIGPVLASILLYSGFGYLLARAARNAGKAIQTRLYDEWGGPPTTQVLRHRDDHFNVHTKERFHAVLSKGLGRPLPSAREEQVDPKAADVMYAAATDWMIGQTRDQKRFPLVTKENIAFGFHRNAFALRPFGICIASLCLGIIVARMVDVSVSPLRITLGAAWGTFGCLSAGTSLLGIVAWFFVLNKEAVRMAGFSYAERLFQACEDLASTSKMSEKKASKRSSKGTP